MATETIAIHTDFITLDAFLMWAGVADTGGNAKALIASGQVVVNGEPETRRGRKLRAGDKITIRNVGAWTVMRRGE